MAKLKAEAQSSQNLPQSLTVLRLLAPRLEWNGGAFMNGVVRES